MTTPDLTALERHHLSEIWGDMEEPLFKALVADVAEVGVREPVVIYDGKVLDGWHRLQAAIAAGKTNVPFITFAGDDPAGFAIRRNALRRPLTTQQRVAIVVMARDWRPQGQSSPGLASRALARTAKELADEAGGSVATVEKVKREVRDGHGEDLAKGRTTLSALERKRRDRSAKKDTVVRPLTKMEKLEAENERLRMERDTALSLVEKLEKRIEQLTRELGEDA